MVHFIARSGSGGGSSVGSGAIVSFSPSGGSYAGTSLDVTISVTNAAKLRWKIDNGVYTTVSATSTLVTVPLTQAGKSLSASALDASNNVLASRTAFYQKPEGGQ